MKEKIIANKNKVIAGIIAFIVIIGAIGAYVYISSQNEPQDSTTVETIDETGISVNVACEGWDADTSTPIALAIYEGDVKDTLLSTDENVEVPTPINEISLNAGEDTKLEDIVDAGTYTLSIVGSPVLEDGTIFNVPDPQVVEYDGENGQIVKFELTKKDASEVTEADIAAATAAATAVGADTNKVTNATNNTRSQASNAQGGSIQQGQGNAQSKPSGGNSSSSGNNSGSSGGNNGSSHTHSWVEQTKTVNHPAEYKTVHHEAVTQSYYVCNGCGAKFSDSGSVGAHIRQGIIDGSDCQSYSTRQETIQAAWDEQVLVKDAWTETVVTGYKCSGCGATK